MLRRVFASSAVFAAAAAAAAVVPCSLAPAAIVTIPFAGTIKMVDDYSGLGYVPAAIQSGSPYVGTVSFDDRALLASSSGGVNVYRGPTLDLSVDLTIAGQYEYTLTTPAALDEIDLNGPNFNLYKRGPTVDTAFAPNPPFSHLEVALLTDTDTLGGLTLADLSIGQFSSAGVSDQQTENAGYYDVTGPLGSLTPEPAATCAVAVLTLAGLCRRRRAV